MQPDTSPFSPVADSAKPDPVGQTTVTQDNRTVYKEPFSDTTYVVGHFTQDKEMQDK